MSIFSRRRKFRNLVSSAISTVVLSSCASQVAQCWPLHIKFDPKGGRVFVEFVRVNSFSYKLHRCKEYCRIFTIEEKSVIRFHRAPETSNVDCLRMLRHEFFPFSPKKRLEVEKFADLLELYLKRCSILFRDLGYKEGDEDAFFKMLDLEDSALEKCNSLKFDNRERVNYLRELSDKIKNQYNDINYKISGICFDGGETLYIVANKPDNVYIDNETFKSKEFQNHFVKKGIKCLKNFQILEEKIFKEKCPNYRKFTDWFDKASVMTWFGQLNQLLDDEIESKDVRCYGYKCGANMGLDSDLDAYLNSEIDAYAKSDEKNVWLNGRKNADINLVF